MLRRNYYQVTNNLIIMTSYMCNLWILEILQNHNSPIFSTILKTLKYYKYTKSLDILIKKLLPKS